MTTNQNTVAASVMATNLNATTLMETASPGSKGRSQRNIATVVAVLASDKNFEAAYDRFHKLGDHQIDDVKQTMLNNGLTNMSVFNNDANTEREFLNLYRYLKSIVNNSDDQMTTDVVVITTLLVDTINPYLDNNTLVKKQREMFMDDFGFDKIEAMTNISCVFQSAGIETFENCVEFFNFEAIDIADKFDGDIDTRLQLREEQEIRGARGFVDLMVFEQQELLPKGVRRR